MGQNMKVISVAQIIAILTCCLIAIVTARFIQQPLVLLVIPLLIPSAWLIIRFPFWVCLGFIIFSFFRIHEAFPVLMPFKLPQLLALASFAVLAWHLFISNSITSHWHPLLSLLTAFFFLIAIGALLATDRGMAMGMLQGSFIKIIVMVFAIVWLVRTPKDFTLTTIAILAAGVLIGGLAIFNKLNGIGLVEGTRVTIGRNIGSMIGDPNDLALVLTFPLSFAMATLLNGRLSFFPRLLAAIATGIVAWAIICTQSRGGLLGLSAVTATLAWHKIDNKFWVVFGGGFLLITLIALAGIGDRSSGGSAEEGIDASAMGRIYAWQAAISMAVHNPITGVGLNNFYANYYFHSPHWDGKNHAVHSTWFQVLAEAGFIGLGLFLMLVIATLRLAHQIIRRIPSSAPPILQQTALALFSGLVGFCTSGTFLTQGFTWPLYILLALTIALSEFLNKTRALP